MTDNNLSDIEVTTSADGLEEVTVESKTPTNWWLIAGAVTVLAVWMTFDEDD